MKTQYLLRKSVLAASVAMLTACGGGGSSSSSSGTTVGVVTGFGSIYVNGVEYETTAASIDIDGSASVETSLNVGDVVELVGSVNADGTTGTATSVLCRDELEGYVLDVSALDINGIGTINVMGQTVAVTADTVFDSDIKLAVTDLVANDIVEISGFPDGTGNIMATRIETKNAATDVEVKGLVNALDTVAMTFSIGGLQVDYSTATQVPTNLADGLYVEVKTDVALTPGVGSSYTMVASTVDVEEDGDLAVDGNEGEDIKVQGMVSDVTASSFRFNGALVEFASLETGDGFDPAMLVNGMIITAEGTIDSTGNFVLKEIAEDHASELEAGGTVTAKTDTTVTLTLADNSTVIVEINNTTRMIDRQDQGVVPLHYFSLADVAIGNYVEVEYYQDTTTGNMVATELMRDDAPTI